jgi:phosphoribosylglycinamide formyltransferase-1
MSDQLRLCMLLSGGGTTAQAIIRACKSGRLSGIKPVCVISSRSDAGGLQKAKEEGVPAFVIEPLPKNSEAFGEALIRACEAKGVDIIGQYGWIPKTPLNVIEMYEGRMINQHPGPLDPGYPDFGGKRMFGARVHCARLYFVRAVARDFWTEATAQRVALDFDKGAILKMARVDILPDDTVSSLQERVLPVEHEVQIEALQDFAHGNVVELVRLERLVLPGEEPILEEAKKIACRKFPTVK